ncbi:MAG: nitroreductase family protein [Ignavibacteria bacterium]|nr:nitroreductase family protein [Ignavibacteria bacterium]
MQRVSANTEQTNEFLSLIKKRWSPKDFDLEKNISPENLQLLFEAARWAPSSRNEQPWNYILVKKDEPEQFEKMIDVLIESNKTWASKASVLVLTLASLRLLRSVIFRRM